MDHAGQRRLRPAARLAGGGHGGGRGAVIRTVAREDLVAPRVGTSDLERVLDGFRAAVGEEEHVDVAGRDLGELRPQPRAWFGRHEARRHVAELLGLLLQRLDDAAIAVADVHRHQLAVEVDVALAFGRVEIDAFGAIDDEGVDVPLYRPFGDRVLLRERGNLGARQLCLGGSAYGSPSGAPGGAPPPSPSPTLNARLLYYSVAAPPRQ